MVGRVDVGPPECQGLRPPAAYLVPGWCSGPLLERLETGTTGQPITEQSPEGRVTSTLIREARMQRQTLDRLVWSLGIFLMEGTSRGPAVVVSRTSPGGRVRSVSSTMEWRDGSPAETG